MEKLNTLSAMMKNPQDLIASIKDLQEENKALKRELDKMQASKASNLKDELKSAAENINGINLVAKEVSLSDGKALKTMVFNLEKEMDNALVLIANVNDGKVQLMLKLSENLVEDKALDATVLIKQLASHIRGGGGGQKFFATAGGSHPDGVKDALNAIKDILAQ